MRDIEIAAEYMNVAFTSNDPTIILTAIRNIVDAQEYGVAENTNLGCESMHKMLSPTGNPKLATLLTLLEGFGLQLQVAPEKKIA